MTMKSASSYHPYKTPDVADVKNKSHLSKPLFQQVSPKYQLYPLKPVYNPGQYTASNWPDTEEGKVNLETLMDLLDEANLSQN